MLTINNPKIPLLAYIEQWMADGNIVFAAGQLEVGASGTPHYQVYIVTKENPSNKNGYTMKWVKDNIHTTAHIEGRQGTHEQAVAYCTKEESRLNVDDAGPFIVGEWEETQTANKSRAGVKGGGVNASKILAVKSAIDQGARDKDLYKEHFGEMLRYGKAFERYRVAMQDKHRSWMTKSLVLYGPPGTGKTHQAYKLARHLFGDDFYPLLLEGGDTVWWDGYCGQKCVIIEEFYGQMKIAYLLKMLDKYPLLVQTKGGMTPFLAEMVIFTSNEHPTMWYGKGAEPGAPSKIPVDVLNALKRRFTGALGTIREMKDVVKNEDEEDFEIVISRAITDAAAPTPLSSPIDLTGDDDDDVDDKTPPEAWQGGNDDDGEENYGDEEYFDDADLQEHLASTGNRRAGWSSTIPVGVGDLPLHQGLQRTLSFHKPAATPGMFKRTGDEPVQTTLAFKKPRVLDTQQEADEFHRRRKAALPDDRPNSDQE